MEKILGLDIGTNSIGWAVINRDLEENEGEILGSGSRIIPMEGREKDFEAGTSVSKTAERRQARGARRLLQRYRLRRERLIKVLKELSWLPNSFPADFKMLSKFNINDYIPFSPGIIDEVKTIFNGENISADWIIYYLRTTALKKEITLGELARIIYHFNQRRGFKSSRKDKLQAVPDTDEIKYPIYEKSVEHLEIVDVSETDERTKFGKIFQIKAVNSENENLTATIIRREKPDFINKTIELEITKKTSKAGEISLTLRTPDRTDWEKLKLALEKDIIESGLFPGEYHFHKLINDRNYRIKDRIIDRSFYQKEFDAIWARQTEYHPELNDTSQLPSLAALLYKHNQAKQKEINSKSLLHLIKNDIIYYQRDLKSQKDLIAECRYEKKTYTTKTGKQKGVKVIPKSAPLFQEYRIWQDVHNIRVIKNEEKTITGKRRYSVDETNLVLDKVGKEKLFNLFDSKAIITQKDIFKALSTAANVLDDSTHRLNYPEEKEFKGNETKTFFRRIFRRHEYLIEGEKLLNDVNKFTLLWHIFYSLKHETHIEKALVSNFGFSTELANYISKLPEFKNDYASYSSKAINKLLAFMRTGSYWNEENIHPDAKVTIEKILNGEVDDTISITVRKEIQEKSFAGITDFQGLQTHLACYLVYGRHSERENEDKFESFEEIKLLELNSLRNPIVEQVTNETLQLVKDIWKQFGRPDEIHIELARDLKKNAEERQKMTRQISINEAERKRVVAILKELANANSNSPADIERLRLWEEIGNRESRETFPKFSKEPTRQEIEKYRLWGEQNHISPYTGKVIPLSKLFTHEYQIEHIIPKSRFFDDSFGNKTICESSVNSFKDNRTAMELIYEFGGQEINYKGNTFRLFNEEEYRQHIKNIFWGKWKKQKLFLSDTVPDGFVERQINDTRYIGKILGELLYPVAKDEIVFTIGSITSELKDKWGLNRIWKELLKPRFQRLEELTGEKLIDFDNDRNDLHFKKDYKRIDHRHHALDAIIVAATSREHIRYLNSLNSAEEKDKINRKYRLVKSKIREFVLPWDSFTKDTKEALNGIIVSHKNRVRVLTKGFNLYTKWVLENGKWIKKTVPQQKGLLLSVRKSMFKEPLGIIKLAEYRDVTVNKAVEFQFDYLTKFESYLQPRIADRALRDSVSTLIKNCGFSLEDTLSYIKENPIKDIDGKVFPKIQIVEFKKYAAKRVALNESFDEKKILKIPYANQKNNRLVSLLKEHLLENDNNPREAFTGEGLESLAKKNGRPITKITTYEEVGNKTEFQGKLVEADKGSNLFFLIYESLDDSTNRIINNDSSISLLSAIDSLANGIRKEELGEDKPGYKKILLSPHDLVYVPEPDEDVKNIDWSNKHKISNKIYKVVSFSKARIYAIPHFVSKSVIEPTELGHNNKAEKAWNGLMIKNVCLKLKVDRLGNISRAN